MTTQILRYLIVGWWLRTMIQLSFIEQAIAMKYLRWRAAKRDARIVGLGKLYEATSEHLRDHQ